MKKRILLIALVVCMALTLCSCSLGDDYDSKYAYSSIESHYVSGEQEELVETMNFVYEDTFLKLSDDGTWCIDMKIILFINSKIDEGTYTMDGDTYVFEGFEYGMDAYGYKTEGGFDVVFYLDALEEDTKLLTLHFVDAE